MHHHYESEKHSARRASAHFWYRSSSAAQTLFDELDDVPRSGSSGALALPTLVEVRIAVPSFSAFLSSHHRTREARTLDVDDVPELVSVSDKILRLLSDGEFHPITEIRDAAGVLSYDRRLRDLRQLVVTIENTAYYLHVDAMRIPDTRTWLYRAHIETFPQHNALKGKSGKSHNE